MRSFAASAHLQTLSLYKQIPGLCARGPAPTSSTDLPLANAYNLVSGNAIVSLAQAIRPYNFDIHDSDLAQPEVQSRIVRGVVAGLAHPRLRLNFLPVVNKHS